MRKWFVLFLCLSIGFVLYAEEGMWLLTQLKQLDLNQQGLEIRVEDIYHPGKPSLSDAVVWLGGCTSSFVSPEGLILTNHHCAYGALQRASSEGKDYITNGFLARVRSEEIPAIGTTASVLQEMKDVTRDILKSAKGITDPLERDQAINTAIAEMTESIQGDRDDILAQVASMYNGKQYFLFVYKRYQDVRLVFAPPESIGNYGDDIDNWMWPRHTGDFSYMRVYMAPDGSGAEYAEENVPVKPKQYLKISTSDLKEGDFTFILGNPGFTTRFRTSNSVGWNLKYNYPETIRDFQERIDLIDELTRDSEEGRIRMANNKAGLANTMKNFQGKVEGMNKTNFLQKKKDFEKELMAFVNSGKKTQEKYGTILERIKAQYDLLLENKAKDDVLGNFGFGPGVLTSLANQIVNVAEERVKPEEERRPGFTERGVQRNIDRLHLQYYNYWEPVDKAMLKRYLNNVQNLPEGFRIEGLEYVFLDNESIESFVEDIYSKSRLSDVEFVKTLFDKSPEELEALDDGFIQMALNVYDEQEDLQDRNEAFGANTTELRKEYIDALYAWKGQGLYPDANGTMRFTYGHVAGYKPADAVWYRPFTSLKGVIEKNSGDVPFNMPMELKAFYKNRDFGQWADPELDDVPVAFTHRCDITGGNSGSPVMNGKGELIGLAFDGNYEAMTSDWQYDYDIQRTISVDIRYVMFITEKYAKAEFLLKEMGIN